MRFKFLFGNFVPSLQRSKRKSESSQTLIPTDDPQPVASPSNISPTLPALHKFWRLFTTALNGSPPHNSLPFRAAERAPCYLLLLHLAPVGAAFVLISFNLYGYWIGKELSGVNNQNAPKELALQLTAKLHELLMLASLSDVLLTHLLKRLATGYGLPFGSLMAGTKFKDLSYIWSNDFWVLCTAGYPHKALVIPLVLLCTMLGLVIGPSSATALIPRLDDWPAGEAVMMLNTSSDLLWPSTLKAEDPILSTCENSTLGCASPLVWDSVAANLFSYFGHRTTGGAEFSPQRVNVPGISSLRNMNIRLKGSLTPDFTIATVPHAVMADMVNSFRFLTFPSRSAKCKKTWSSAMCSYQDVSWYVDSMQPVVITACLETQLNASTFRFPVISHVSTPLTASIDLHINPGIDEAYPRFQWLSAADSQFLNASIGAVVQLGTAANPANFACTIQAQWANSTTATNFASTNYIVSGSILELGDAYRLADQRHGSQSVAINSDLAQQTVDTAVGSQNNNFTVLERFLSLGEADRDLSVQLEAALSVLFSERMAHTGSGTIPLSITSRDLFLKKHGSLIEETSRATQLERSFILKTSMTGYGYGLHNTSGLSTSTLISIILLGMYATFAMVHLVSLCLSSYPYVVWGRDEREVLLACLFSNFRPRIPRMQDADGGGVAGVDEQWDTDSETAGILKDIVILTGRDGRAEVMFRSRDRPEEEIPLTHSSAV